MLPFETSAVGYPLTLLRAAQKGGIVTTERLKVIEDFY
jgi:hypothetical protein